MRAASHNCDAIVVGAGLSGSIVTLSLALWGFRVLLIETGGRRPDGPPARQAWLRKIGHRLAGAGAHPDPDRWNAPILHYSHRNSRTPRETEAILGRGVGGSSTLYAAALGRMRRKDFEVSRRGAPTDLEQPLPNAWPISFNEFRIYYRRAEALLRIAGERDPLDADDDSDPVAPPDLSPRDAVICERLVRNGLHPYRLRVGFDYKPGCAECQGRRCPIGCKADGESRALAAALATGRVTLETDATVESIAQGPEGVSVRIRSASDEIETRAAATLVLAAGALNTPLILARSPGLWPDAPPPAMLGRGLMFHISEIFAVRVPRRLGRSNVRKTLALRDFYDAGAESLGEIQSMGLDLSTGQAMHYLREIGSARLLRGVKGLAEFFRPFAWAAAKIVGPAPVFATITEDLPYAHNRVWEAPATESPRGAPRIAICYERHPWFRAESTRMRAQIRRIFAPFPILFFGRSAAPNMGHPMGTCRMGTDPTTSVIDPSGRLWGCPNIYVADTSAFPSSSGVGPSLTVAAHALRVADQIALAAADSARPAAAAAAPA